MKYILYSVIICICLSTAVFSQTQIITVFEAVKIKSDNRQEALYYYENNWKLLRDKAVKKGFIHSFEFIETKAIGDTDFDLILITRYQSKDQFDRSEFNFQRLIREFITDRGGLKLINDLKPDDFRENVFVKTGTSILSNR